MGQIALRPQVDSCAQPQFLSQARNYIEAKEAFVSLNFWKKLPENFGMTNSMGENIINSHILHLKASKMHQINTKISKNF